jgi:hypothetical protein
VKWSMAFPFPFGDIPIWWVDILCVIIIMSHVKIHKSWIPKSCLILSNRLYSSRCNLYTCYDWFILCHFGTSRFLFFIMRNFGHPHSQVVHTLPFLKGTICLNHQTLRHSYHVAKIYMLLNHKAYWLILMSLSHTCHIPTRKINDFGTRLVLVLHSSVVSHITRWSKQYPP